MSSVLNRKSISPNHEIVYVSINAEKILPNFEKQLKEYAKKAEIQGFRKGMVPFSLVKKMYGAGIFTREIYDNAEKQLMDYVKEEKLEILGQPLLSKIPDNTPDFNQKDAVYTFEFEIGLRPTITLPELEKANFVKYNITTTDEMIADNIKRLQQEYGKEVAIEKIENENTVIDFLLNDQDKERVAQLKVFSKSFQEKLLNKKIEDSIQFIPNKDVEENSQYVFKSWNISEEQVAETFNLVVKKINKVEPALLDKDFFDKVYPNQNIETEETFKEKIKEETGQYFAQQVKHQFQHQLEHFFSDNTKMEMPAEFLKKWFSTTGEKKKTEEEVEKELPTLINQLRWNFIIQELQKLSNVEVQFEEIKAEFENRIKSYYQNNVSEEIIRDHVMKLMQNEEYVYNTQQQFLVNKVFDWVETKVQLTSKDITIEDFIKQQTEHQHQHHE